MKTKSVMSLKKLSSPSTRLERSCEVNRVNEANCDANCSTVPETSDNADRNTSLKNQIGSDSLCSLVPESCEDGDQNITHPDQTVNIVDVMVVEKEPCGKSLDGIHKPRRSIVGGKAQCSTVPERSPGDGQNRGCRKQTPNTVDEMVLQKEACIKVPENVNGTETPRAEFFDSIELEVCIKCNEGGNLLVCSDRNCPLAVHEECLQCSPHFGSMGRFFCPHCACKQIILATHKAKKAAMLAKTALSIFLDRRLLGSDPQDENAGTVRSGEENHPENEEVDVCCGKTQVNQPGERSDLELRTSDVPCDGAMLSAANEKNNALGRCQDSGGSVDGRAVEIENRIITEQASASVIGKNPKDVDDVLNKRVLQNDQEADVISKKRKLGVEPEKSKISLDDKDTEKEEEEEIDEEEVEEENSKVTNDSQHDQEEATLGKRQKLVVEAEKSTEWELDNEKTKEAEKGVQDRGTEANGSSSGEDSVEENDEVVSDSVDGDGEGALRSLKRNGKKKQNASSRNVKRSRRASRKVYIEGDEKEVHKKKSNTISKSIQASSRIVERLRRESRKVYIEGDEKEVHKKKSNTISKSRQASSKNVERLRRESRKVYSEGGEKEVHKKKITISKSRQATTNATFPNGKRKRHPWTAEEEEMLKEGVRRFSLTANTNLPWKKILDFGRHVFLGTRDAEHLKDKWRALQSIK